MDLAAKLAVLADAAKYDASCASSGMNKRHSRDGHGLGSTTGAGICHSYTPDGRCVSLLKAELIPSLLRQAPRRVETMIARSQAQCSPERGH